MDKPGPSCHMLGSDPIDPALRLIGAKMAMDLGIIPVMMLDLVMVGPAHATVSPCFPPPAHRQLAESGAGAYVCT